MKVVFCSNYMNHHQLYFSKAMLNQGDRVEYYFIASEKISFERIKLGWEDMNYKYDWVVRMYDGFEQKKRAELLIKEADLVIVGTFPFKILRGRIFARKPVFVYSERWFKSSDGDMTHFKNMHNFLSNLLHRTYLNCFNVYMLCASAYTAYDCSIYHNFINKCYKWGYFPDVKKYDIDALIAKKRQNEKIEILWVARMIQFKHPEYPVFLADRLKKDGYNFEINMIGVGENLNQIEKQIEELDLTSNVHLLGSMSTEDVRGYMEQANIFLFTSDFNEGWGAVLNEAMNSGCAVVASHAIGSVPFLIEDTKNGFIYNFGNKEEFYEITKKLIDNQGLREKVSKEAYYTLINEWNPENAANRLLMLYDNLFNKKNNEIISGVCSKAEILDNFWRKPSNY